jgi:hypothetical protein
MLRRAVFLAALMLLAVFVSLGFSLAADTALAAEYTSPTTPFTEPVFTSNGCFASPAVLKSTEESAVEVRTVQQELALICLDGHQQNVGLAGRLFWLTDELIKAREQVESLKVEVVKGLGSEGSIAKGLAQLHTDLTPSEGLPIRWKSQAVEPEVRFKTAQAVTLASLPELSSGTKAIGTVKVTSLEGEPAIKVGNEPAVKVAALPELHAGTQAIGTVKVTSLEGEPAVKVGNEPAVKVAALPELHAGTQAIGTVKVASLEGEPVVKMSAGELVDSVDAAGEASQAGLYLIAGLLAGLFVAACLWKVVDRGT